MVEQPIIHTGGIGEAIAMGEYLRQQHSNDAIVSAVGEVVDDRGVRAYLPTFVEEAARIYREYPDQAIAYADIGGRPGYLEASTRYILPGEFAAGHVAQVAVAGLASAIYTTLQVVAKRADVFVPEPYWPHYPGMIEDLEGRYHGFPLLNSQQTFNAEALAASLQEIPRQGTVAIILNTPCHNPTGYSLTRDDWQRLKEVVWEHAEAGKRLCLVLDTAYVDYYWHQPQSIQQDIIMPLMPLHERVTLAIGWTISKTFLAYGQRLGTLLMIASSPQQADDLQQRVYRATMATYSQCSTVPQLAIENLHADAQKLRRIQAEREPVRAMLARRNAAFETALAQTGLVSLPGDGGFFRTVELPAGISAVEVVRRLAEKRVAMVAAGEQRLRVAICSVPEGMMLAMCERISEAVQEIAESR
ncbi:MAG TPA: pyridoxal phosphate-dependent aminotransferase [Candidatus Tectomicrobia bacterium]|nr:pyridoxal phosphate-dependent aminotransferase [Candidatus Tectomicrobia bacterium]